MVSNIVEFIKQHPVSKYQNCRTGNLWYVAGDFEFPIPLEEVEGGIFHSEMDTQILKRWIRKHMTFLEKSGNEVTNENTKIKIYSEEDMQFRKRSDVTEAFEGRGIVVKINGDEMVSTVKKE